MVEIRGPIDIGRIVRTQNEEILGFEVTVKDIAGALAHVSKVFADHNINLVHLIISRRYNEPYVDIIIFADFTDRRKSADLIADELLKMKEYVVEVSVFEKQLPTLIAEMRRYPLTVLGERVVAFREPILRGIIKGFAERLGAHQTHVFLWHLGLSIGKELYKSYKEMGAHYLEDYIKFTSVFGAAMGWGVVGNFYVERNKVTIQLLRNWECEMSEEEGVPRNHFIRGVLAGIISGYFNRNIKITEVRCIGKGDEYCEFVASW
jgi:hypothetical protein